MFRTHEGPAVQALTMPRALRPIKNKPMRSNDRPNANWDATEVGSLDVVAPLGSDRLVRRSMFMQPVALPTRPAALAEADPVPTLKIVIKGFKPMERQLLEGTVRVSQRRKPRLAVLDDIEAISADVIMIDTRDAPAMEWAQRQAWLKRKAVIWVDATSVDSGHTIAKRPVQWPILPMLLARALEQGPGSATQLAAAAATTSSLVQPPRLDRSVASFDASPQSILIVDDSLAVRAYLRSLLEARGFLITEAVSAHAALDAVTQQRFACVLMDVLMPGIDGYEGCRQIKAKLRGAQAVPVVMLTSKSSPFDRIRGKMAGCDAYLTKPVDPKQLTDVLAQQVPARAGSDR